MGDFVRIVGMDQWELLINRFTGLFIFSAGELQALLPEGLQNLVPAVYLPAGLVGLLLLVFLLTDQEKKEEDSGGRTWKRAVGQGLKSPVIFLGLPAFLIWDSINPVKLRQKIQAALKTKKYRKVVWIWGRQTLALSLTAGLVLPLWVSGYFSGYKIARERLNLVEDAVAISGTGSMYPTFPKGESKTVEEQTAEIVATPGMRRYPSGINLWGKEFFGYVLARGDIVAFANEKTAEITMRELGRATGFVKRIIGLPGDVLEMRSGLLYLNAQPQKEAYTARARSTFGGAFLPECQEMVVPEGYLFVLGDNRKGSHDSRHELGLIKIGDVDHVIPWNSQLGVLDWGWHDTSNDLEEEAKISLDTAEYLKLVNQIRAEAGVDPVKWQEKLAASAAARGKVMLQFNDFSFEATRSGLTMTKAMDQAGYQNIVWGEAHAQGYYEADEFLENQLAFPQSKEFLLNGKYQDLGVAVVEGELNGCPTQIIVQHLGGYVPPNYSAAEVSSWRQGLLKLNEIQPGWLELLSYEQLYSTEKTKIDRINEIIAIRIGRFEAIVRRMEANQWLTPQEQRYMEEDRNLAAEQERLAKELNSSNRN